MNNQSIPDHLKYFWQQGFFKQEASFDSVMKYLDSVGSHPTPQALNSALSRAKFLTKRGKPGNYRYIQKSAASGISLGKDVLPDELIIAMKKDFKIELEDFRHNYGFSGTCSAFLLRKILEKLIFLVFAKAGEQDKLHEPDGRMVGLATMLTLAKSTKVGGKPFLMPKTADEIQGVKFLGDSAAHNPLTNVSMKTVEHVMPFIITAYSELVTRL